MEKKADRTLCFRLARERESGERGWAGTGKNNACVLDQFLRRSDVRLEEESITITILLQMENVTAMEAERKGGKEERKQDVGKKTHLCSFYFSFFIITSDPIEDRPENRSF